MSDTKKITTLARTGYRGFRWACKTPPVCTARWTDDSWIRYIGIEYLEGIGELEIERFHGKTERAKAIIADQKNSDKPWTPLNKL